MTDKTEKQIVNHLFEITSDIKWHERIYYRFLNSLRECRYFFKKIYQRCRYGFALEQVWEFRMWHSEIVVPRLKLLKERNMGYPGGLTNEEWHDILGKMIWSFENNDVHISPIYSEDYDHRYELIELDNGNTQYIPLNETGTVDWSPVEKHNARVQEGLDLFAKYYLNLCD